MARVAITINTIPANGGGLSTVTKTAADATNDHEMDNDGNTLIFAENLDSATKTITIKSVADEYGRTGDTTLTVPVAAAGVPGTSVAGPFRLAHWNQSGGKVHIDITDATALKFYAVRFSLAR